MATQHPATNLGTSEGSRRPFASGILLAAGSGSRMQGTVEDKILAPLSGLPVICHSIKAFLQSGIIGQLTIVYRDAPQRAELEAALTQIDLSNTQISWVEGGSQRQESVHNALTAQTAECTHVFIHDCARPLISVEALQALNETVLRDNAAVLAHPVTDTIKRIPASDHLTQTNLEDLDRNRLWAMETPQAFAYPEILKAYKHVRENKLTITDDTAAAATIGLKTTIVPNDSPNPKITKPEDLAYAELLVKCR